MLDKIDIIELSRAYIGTIFLGLIGCYQSSGIPGIFGDQLNIILDVCEAGSLGCPF